MFYLLENCYIIRVPVTQQNFTYSVSKTVKVSINFCTITVAIILSTRGYGYGNGDQLLSYISTLLIVEIGAVIGLLGYRKRQSGYSVKDEHTVIDQY